MSKQLRLVESPEQKKRTRQPRQPRQSGRATTAKVAKVPRIRRAHWAVDWRLDATTRQTGRAGVQAARASLARARRPDTDLRRAS